jgi:hypothetical protein
LSWIQNHSPAGLPDFGTASFCNPYFKSISFASVVKYKCLRKFKNFEGPAVSLVEEGIQIYPARSDIGGGEREDILAGSGLSAVVSD